MCSTEAATLTPSTLLPQPSVMTHKQQLRSASLNTSNSTLRGTPTPITSAFAPSKANHTLRPHPSLSTINSKHKHLTLTIRINHLVRPESFIFNNTIKRNHNDWSNDSIKVAPPHPQSCLHGCHTIILYVRGCCRTTVVTSSI